MKVRDKIQQDFRGGKLGKMQRIANRLLVEADEFKEEAKNKSLDIILDDGIPTKEQFLEISGLVLKAEANVNTANTILDLLSSD